MAINTIRVRIGNNPQRGKSVAQWLNSQFDTTPQAIDGVGYLPKTWQWQFDATDFDYWLIEIYDDCVASAFRIAYNE